jgi:hypothetical protein
MILGCRNSNHDYIVRDNLIKYKDQDGYTSKISYGYSTQFAYLKEYEKKHIISAESAYKLSCVFAEFSYALLPKYFISIIGVTGTYK